MNIKDGGPAFPFEGPTEYFGGMSLRDYIAIEAMNALIPVVFGLASLDIDEEECLDALDKAPTSAYEFADAMLAEREKNG